MLFSTWIDADGNAVGGWNAPPDLDWFRVLGIVRAGALQVERKYLGSESIGDEDED